ncbi:MFS transporter [Nonomuraea sp. NPDC050556]|uniref:MFS transporter n=1 Tax=Nonomuraea sp. NPDC050556 TaxID=3364369 RepID=UPI0037B3C0A1
MTPHRSIALVFALHGAVAGSLSTRIPWLQDHLALTPAVLGLVLLCQPIGAFIAMPMASRLAYRIGGRRTTRVLIVVWCAILALPALAPAPIALFAVFVLYGMAAGTSDVVMNSQGVLLERRMGRSIIAGLHGMWCVGSLAAGGIGVLAAQAGVDARLHLSVMAVVLTGIAVMAGRGLAEDATGTNEVKPRRFALPSKAILAVGLVGFCGTFAEGASSNWAAVYVTKVASAGPGVAAATFTVFMLCMAVTRLVGDWFVRRAGAVAVVRTGGAVAAGGGVLVVLGRTPWVCMAGFALIGVGVAVIVPLVFAAAGRAGTTPGEGVAGVATITYLSGLIAPAVTGWAAGALSYQAAFAMITGVVVVMVLLAGALRPKVVAEERELVSVGSAG